VRKTLDKYADSWNQHDTKTFASLFTEDCDYVNIGGAHWQGVEENVRQHTRLFRDRLAGVVQSSTNVQIRFPRPDVALVHTNWDVTGYTRPTGEKVDVLKRNHDHDPNQSRREMADHCIPEHRSKTGKRQPVNEDGPRRLLNDDPNEFLFPSAKKKAGRFGEINVFSRIIHCHAIDFDRFLLNQSFCLRL
jgi:uncharacterized protein (TIGR02246 family)